jgi:DNA-binding transcriptional MerR regulator
VSTLTVSRLAERVGLSADTVRYYERARLLPAASRTSGGYRSYDEAAVERLRFIQGAKRLGLRLREIRDLLDALDKGLCPCGHIEELITARVGEIDAEVARLLALRETLELVLVRNTSAPCDAKGWECAEQLLPPQDGEVSDEGS